MQEVKIIVHREDGSDYIAHYGVQGMKWGVRRAVYAIGTARDGRRYKKAQAKDEMRSYKKALRIQARGRMNFAKGVTVKDYNKEQRANAKAGAVIDALNNRMNTRMAIASSEHNRKAMKLAGKEYKDMMRIEAKKEKKRSQIGE